MLVEDLDPPSPRLVSAWRALSPREARLLTQRLIEGASIETCASRLGIARDAFAVHQLRALQGLADLLREVRPRPRPEDTGRERERAELLERHVARSQGAGPALRETRGLELSASAPRGRGGDAGAPEIRAEDAALISLAQQVWTRRTRLVTALAAAEAADALAPSRRRLEWLRRLAIAALIALALWFGLR